MAATARRSAESRPAPPPEHPGRHRLRAAATACALAAIAGVVPAGSAQAAGVPSTGTPTAGAAATAQSVCPDALAPPPPQDTSERPLPGGSAPPPVPAPPAPVGGPQMGTCGQLLPPGAPPPPAQVQVVSWTLADLDSGAVIAAQAPHDRERPASTIKVLTALLALRELKPTDTIVATQQDADQEGSKVGLEAGQTYTVRQVITGMLLRSGNDAAHALAARLGGDQVTTEKMTELAHQLGAEDTRVATPAGLDGPGMSTSAYDLAVIFREAMKNPEFAQAVNTPQITLPGKPGQPPKQITNDNQFTGKYPGALGGKPGFTDDARHTFIAAAQRGNRRLEAVLMRGENKPPNHQNEQAMRLLDYGFSLPPGPPVGQLHEQPAPPPPPRADSTRPASASAQDEGGFGAVAAPLGIVVIVAAAVAVVLVQRRRRARAAGEQSDEHP